MEECFILTCFPTVHCCSMVHSAARAGSQCRPVREIWHMSSGQQREVRKISVTEKISVCYREIDVIREVTKRLPRLWKKNMVELIFWLTTLALHSKMMLLSQFIIKLKRQLPPIISGWYPQIMARFSLYLHTWFSTKWIHWYRKFCLSILCLLS